MRFKGKNVNEKNKVLILTIFTALLFIGTAFSPATADTAVLSASDEKTEVSEDEIEKLKLKIEEYLSEGLISKEKYEEIIEKLKEFLSDGVLTREELDIIKAKLVPSEETTYQEKTVEVSEEKESTCALCGEVDTEEIKSEVDFSSFSADDEKKARDVLNILASNADGIKQISSMSRESYIDLLEMGKSELLSAGKEIKDPELRKNFARVALMVQDEIAFLDLSKEYGLVYAKSQTEIADDTKPDLEKMPKAGEEISGTSGETSSPTENDPDDVYCDEAVWDDCLRQGFQEIKDRVGPIWDAIKESDIYKSLSAAAKDALASLIQWGLDHPAVPLSGLFAILSKGAGALAGLYDTYLLPIMQILDYLPSAGFKLKLLKWLFFGIAVGIPIGVFLKNHGKDLLDAWNNFKDSELYDIIKNGIKNGLGFAWDAIKWTGSAIGDSIEAMVDLLERLCEKFLNCTDPNEGNGSGGNSTCFLAGTMVPTFNLPDGFSLQDFLNGGSASSSLVSGSSLESDGSGVGIVGNINMDDPTESSGGFNKGDSSGSAALSADGSRQGISDYVEIKNIEDVEIGEQVLSYNEETGEPEIALVSQVLHHKPQEMTEYYLKIYLKKDGEIAEKPLEVTPNHYLSVEEKTEIKEESLSDESIIEQQSSASSNEIVFKQAGELKAGDLILGYEIVSIEKIYERVPTYDLKVQGSIGSSLNNYAILPKIPDIVQQGIASSSIEGVQGINSLQTKIKNNPKVVGMIPRAMMVKVPTLLPTIAPGGGLFGAKNNANSAAATTSMTSSTATAASTSSTTMVMKDTSTNTVLPSSTPTGSTSI